MYYKILNSFKAVNTPSPEYIRLERVLTVNKELRTALYNAYIAGDYQACEQIYNRIKRLRMNGILFKLLSC